MSKRSFSIIGIPVVIAKFVLREPIKKHNGILIALLALTLAGVGCVSQSSQQRPVYNSDVYRSNLALNRVHPAFSGDVVIRLLNSPKAAAYSCNDGTIYLTSGLFHLLNDDELCAAIAHEMGHLARSTTSVASTPYALRGNASSDAEEQRADAVAVKILRQIGISPTVLARVLEKVRDDARTPANLYDAMTVRIGLLPRE